MDFTKEIPEEVQALTFLTAPTVSPDELPPEGQKFYDDFSAEYGDAADEIDPYAIYGYEAANVVLDCIEENAGSIDRRTRLTVVRQSSTASSAPRTVTRRSAPTRSTTTVTRP